MSPPSARWLTRSWGVSLPLARYVVPAVGLAAVAGGALVNLAARKERVARERAPLPVGAAVSPPAEVRRTLPRHRAGIRFLHWFNALSWLVLLVTGTALLSAKSFALFGTAFPRWLAALFGGAEPLLRLHVGWGLAWALLTIPLFLLYEGGVRAVLREVRLTPDDRRWLMAKPLALAGLRRRPLPPQDRYNAGQKLFAMTALAGTATIVASGLVMALHLGPASVVAAAILAHQLAIALALLGLTVHVTMAAVLKEERPALRSMVTGRIDRDFAAAHSPRWVAELEASAGEPAHRRAGPGGRMHWM